MANTAMANFCKLHARVSIPNGIRCWPMLAALPLAVVIGLAFSQSSRGDAKSAKAHAKAPAKTKHTTQVDTVDESADDGDLDDDLAVLVVPARFLAKSKEADRLKFSQELRGLFSEGLKEKGAGLDAARKHFDAAHRLVGDDPRAAYAYGLVLVAQKKTIVALDQFRSAAKLKQVPYLPALQGVAWMSLTRGDHADAHAALVDLANRLEESRENWPTAENKEHSAEWLGRMIGFLAGPGKTADQAANIDKLAAEVANRLTAERKLAYERGRKAAAARYAELKTLAARPPDELLAEANREREAVRAAVAAAESEVKQLESELRDLKKPHDKQLADLSRDMRTNAKKVKTTELQVPEAEAEVEQFSAPKLHPQVKSQGFRRPTKVVARNENAGEKKIRESQLASAQKKLDRLNASIEEARQAIADARKQRDASQVEYRKATAGKRQALLAAQHKAAELTTRAREAEQGALTPEKLKARVTSLDSYVPLYPEVERDRILAGLKPAS